MAISKIILSFSIFSFFITTSWARPLVVISDLDDTLKITQVQSSGRAVWNGIFTRKVFTGIPLLWNSLQSYSHSSYVLTSSPDQLRFNIEKLFQKYDMQVDALITRNVFQQRDSFVYKYQAIQNIMQDHPESQFILMGDNTDQDDEVYQRIQNEHPQRVVAIYMHKVKATKIPSGQIPWITTFDIAYEEFLADRMSYSEAVAIFDLIMQSSLKKLIPTKLYCPKQKSAWEKTKTSDLLEMRNEIIEKVIKYCRKISKASF